MKNSTTKWILIGAVGLVVIGLGWSTMSGTGGGAATFGDSNVVCLPSGHANLALHVHPQVAVTVDGTEEFIPANMGITPTCMAEVHTHDGTGVLHVESSVRGKTFDLLDFFVVLGKPFEREGYEVQLLVGGEPVADPGTVILNDLDQVVIEVQYTSGNADVEGGEVAVEEEMSTTTDEE